MQRLLHFVRDMLIIRRVEFRIAEIPILGIAIALTAANTDFFGDGSFWELVILFFMLFAFGDMINVLADRELDATYKTKLSNAVYALGVRFVAFQVVAYGAIAIVLALHIGVSRDNPLVPFFTLSGLVLGSQYSVKPLHLKSKGIFQLLCLWVIIFVGPMLLVAAYFQHGDIDASFVALAIAYGGLQMGIILVNTAEDYPEDKAAGVRNTTVALGLAKGLGLAALLVFVGGAVHIGMALWISHERGLSGPYYAAIGVLALAWAVITVRLSLITRKVASSSLDEAIVYVKQRAKFVPIALTFTAWPTFVWAVGILRAQL